MTAVATVIPVYNGYRGQEEPTWLRAALMSAVNTDFQGIHEIIVVNDGSTDKTGLWLDDHVAMLPDRSNVFIKWATHEKNLGAAAAFNRGVEIAGEDSYIALLGSDDLSHPDRIEKQAAFLDEHPDIPMVGCYYDTIDADGNLIETADTMPTDPADIRRWLYARRCDIGVPMFRYSLWQELGGFDSKNFPTRASDYDFYLRTVERYDIGLIPEVLYFVRLGVPRLSDDKHEHMESAYRAVTLSRDRRRQTRRTKDK